MERKAQEGDWYETPEGLLKVDTVIKCALVCWLYGKSTITEIIRHQDHRQGWVLIGQRNQNGVTEWLEKSH